MNLRKQDGAKPSGTGRSAGASLALAALAALVASNAAAVVGGADDRGPLSRATVMVLNSKGGVCSGLVVARDAVLTAAHCLDAPEIRVHFRSEAGEPVLIAPAARDIHPGFQPRAVEARRASVDLALLRLPEPLPARFETATLSGAPAPNGTGVTLGGYGVDREGDPRSTGTFRSAALEVVEPYGPSRILVWMRGAQRGACTGDSGGPVAAAGDVFALASWAKGAKGRKCGETSQGVLLGPQRDWLDRTLQGWGRRAQWR